jgi:hypothetical protein
MVEGRGGPSVRGGVAGGVGDDAPVVWLDEQMRDGVCIARVGRIGPPRDLLVADFPGFARFTAKRDGSDAELVVAPGADPVFVEKFHASVARALLRQLEGGLTLHGGAVAMGGRAFAFVGASGAGKSTTTAALAARGHPLIADDTVALEQGEPFGITVVPMQAVAWLEASAAAALFGGGATAQPGAAEAGATAELPPFAEDDAEGARGPRGARNKTAFSPPEVAPAPLPLAAVVELTWSSAPELAAVERLRGGRAFAALSKNMFRFVVDEKGRAEAELASLASIAARVPVLSFRRPRDLAGLQRGVDALLAALHTI